MNPDLTLGLALAGPCLLGLLAALVGKAVSRLAKLLTVLALIGSLYGIDIAEYNAHLNLHEHGVWGARVTCKESVDGALCYAATKERVYVLRCPSDRAPAWCAVRSSPRG